MTNEEIDIITKALELVVQNVEKWSQEYYFDKQVGEYFHKKFPRKEEKDFKPWFEF